MSGQNQNALLKKTTIMNQKCKQIVKMADENKIPELMECCLCGGVPSPNYITACQDGHFMCAGCHRKSPRGLCAKDLDYNVQTGSRRTCNKLVSNFKCALYNYFYNNSVFTCGYAELGCLKANFGRDLRAHRLNCDYRPILPCTFTDCQNRASPLVYSNHLLAVHQIFEIDSDTHRIQMAYYPIEKNTDTADSYKKIRWAGGILNCYGFTFVLLAEELGQDIYIWVTLGTSKDPKGRQFKCRLGLGSEKSASVVWRGIVYPFKNIHERDLPPGLFFKISKKDMAENFFFKVDGQHFWFTDVEIKEEIPERNIPGLTSATNDKNQQSVTPGLTTAKIYEEVFGKVEDSE